MSMRYISSFAFLAIILISLYACPPSDKAVETVNDAANTAGEAADTMQDASGTSNKTMEDSKGAMDKAGHEMKEGAEAVEGGTKDMMKDGGQAGQDTMNDASN